MNYYEIKEKSTVAPALLELAMAPGDWYEYYNFTARAVPNEPLIELDPLFKWLSTRYSFVTGVLRMDPYTCYDWHTDTRRGVGINMSLTPMMRSSSMFAPQKEGQVFKIAELQYKPNTYYLYNTQVPHTVYNYETTRFMFSVEFELDKDQLTFEDLMQDIKENYEKDSAE
jgi:hypothetical protein